MAAAHAPPAFGLVAGEASGDNLGGPLIHALAAREPGAGFYGVAGPRMVAAGCEAWYPADALAVKAGVGCAAAIIRGLLTRKEPTCGPDGDACCG